MKFTVFGTYLLCLYILVEISHSYSEISRRPVRSVYDMLQIVHNAAKIMETAKRFGIDKEDIKDLVQKINFSKLIPILTEIAKSAKNIRCYQDLLYIKESIHLTDIENSWALQMLDSFGKPESGFLEGNFKWIGNFDECVNAYAPRKKDKNVGGFHGQYCSLKLNVEIIPVTIGLCLPETCDPADFDKVLNISNSIPMLYEPDMNLKIDSLTCQSNKRELSDGGVITIFIISIFIFLALLGSSITAFKHLTSSETSIDSNTNQVPLNSFVNDLKYYNDLNAPKIHCLNHSYLGSTPVKFDSEKFIHENYKRETVGEKGAIAKFTNFICNFLNCFCIFTNGAKLLNTDVTEEQLSCIHGIRFLSMSWVILCHVYLSSILVLRTFRNAIPLVDGLPFQVVFNGWYSVDSFFVLSGCLLAYLYFKERAKRTSALSWFYFYFHRFLRLTPLYMIVLAFYTTVSPLLGSGPFWLGNKVEEHCQKTWWWNLLYINNFQNLLDECMPWAWYLANDMQFFIISPLFLITLWRWPKVGYSLLALFVCGSWLSGFLITYYYGMIAGSLSNVIDIAKDPFGFVHNWMEYVDKIYLKPYVRISPYLIGIGLGHMLFKKKMKNSKVGHVTLWIGWLIAIPAGLYCVYGLYQQTPGVLGASFYNALIRTAWGLSLSWLIFVCLSGHGGVVNKILSYKIFIPLSRLTYCAYLIHPLCIGGYILTLRTTLDFNHTSMVILYLGLITMTYACSLVVSLLFESPLVRLEKLLKSAFQSRCKGT